MMDLSMLELAHLSTSTTRHEKVKSLQDELTSITLCHWTMWSILTCNGIIRTKLTDMCVHPPCEVESKDSLVITSSMHLSKLGSHSGILEPTHISDWFG